MAQHELLVKLGLQSESFTRNIRNVNNQLKLTEAEFKKLETSTKNFGNSQKDLEAKLKSLKTTKEQLTAKTLLYKNKIEELNTKIKDAEIKHEGLAKKLENEKSKLSELEATQGKNSKAYKEQSKVVKDLQQEYDKSKKNIENFNLSLQKNKIDLANTETALNKVKNAISELNFEKATFGLTQFSNKLSSISKGLDVVSQKFGAAGRTLSTSITAPIALAGSSIVKFGAEFSTSMSEVKALSGATGEDFKELESKAREMGKATSFTAKEAADGLGYMALAGWNTREMLEGIEPVLRLAEAGNLDLATTSDLVTDSMSSLGLTTADLSKYLDIVATSSANSNTKVDQMLRTYNQVGGTFKRLNVPLEESAALIGVLANRGLKAEQAGRSVSSLLINLTGGSTSAAKALKELGVNAYDSNGKFKGIEKVLLELHGELNKVENGTRKYTDAQKNMYLSMIGGKTQIRTLDAMLNGVAETTANGTTEFQELKEELLNSEGALAKMADTMKDNLQGDWEKFTSMVGELKLKLFDLVEGPLRKFVQSLTNLTEKFVNLDSDSQKFIIKTALIAASIGPVLLAVSGLTKGLSLMTGGLSLVISGFINFGKTIFDIAGGVRSGMSLFSAMSATIAGLPAILGIAAAAFVGITAAIGENEFILAKLQEKWGTFGTVISRVCETISGIVQYSIGNILIILGTLGKVISKAITLQWDEIDDVMREGASKLAQNTEKATYNMAGASTKAIKLIRQSTSTEMQGLVSDCKFILDELPGVTYDTAGTMAEKFATGLSHLDNNSISILKSTSDTMLMLFRGISEGMDNEAAVAQYTKNLESLARTGGVSASELQREIEKTLNLINDNMADSGDRFAREAEVAMDKFGSVASQGVEKAAGDIASHLAGLDATTMDSLKGMGNNWSLIFKNIVNDGTISVEGMAITIEDNIRRMAKNNPKFVQQLREEMKLYFDKIPEDAETNMLSLENAISNGSESAKSAASGTGKDIEKELQFEAKQLAEEELGGMQETFDSYGDPIEQSASNLGSQAAKGYEEGLSGLDTTTTNKLQEQTANIQNNGENSKAAMRENAVGSIEGFIETWDANSGRINESVNATFDNINRLTLLKWGNTTKGLSEVNKWLGTVANKSITTYSAISKLTSLKWGNTTRGLSEVNKWLGTVSTSSNSTKAAITPLTALKWGNTTKGLSEVNKWLGTVATSSKTTKVAIEAITKISFVPTTKGLSEINKWLGTVKNSASSAASYLRSISNVSFGGVTKGLSEVNRWLGTVASKASSARAAISSVSTARVRTASLDSDIAQAYARVNVVQPEPTLYRYRTSYGEDFISRILPNAKNSSNSISNETNNNNNDSLVTAIFALIDAISNKDINASVNIDGKQIATATAPFIRNEIERINIRRNRLAGI